MGLLLASQSSLWPQVVENMRGSEGERSGMVTVVSMGIGSIRLGFICLLLGSKLR